MGYSPMFICAMKYNKNILDAAFLQMKKKDFMEKHKEKRRREKKGKEKKRKEKKRKEKKRKEKKKKKEKNRQDKTRQDKTRQEKRGKEKFLFTKQNVLNVTAKQINKQNKEKQTYKSNVKVKLDSVCIKKKGC
jgi:hypothetical protein